MRKNPVRQDALFFVFTDLWSELNSWIAPEREERNGVKLKMKQHAAGLSKAAGLGSVNDMRTTRAGHACRIRVLSLITSVLKLVLHAAPA